MIESRPLMSIEPEALMAMPVRVFPHWGSAAPRFIGAAMICALAGCTWQDVRNTVADYHVQRGETAASRNDLDAALREFSAAVRLNPQSAVGYSRIGDIERRRGDFAAAVSYFAEAVRLDPFDFGSALSLGQTYQVL